MAFSLGKKRISKEKGGFEDEKTPPVNGKATRKPTEKRTNELKKRNQEKGIAK